MYILNYNRVYNFYVIMVISILKFFERVYESHREEDK